MTARRWLQMLVPAAAGLAVLVLAFPTATGTTWGSTFRVLGSISLRDAALLATVWLAGLCCYTVVMRASLPGLSVPQALTLNLGGSAVSNVLPFGGAAGIGLNFAMATSWGYRRSSFAAFTAVTSLVNIVAKLLLPVAAVVVVAASGQPHLRPLVWCAELGGGLLAVAALVTGASVLDNPVARRLRRLEWLRPLAHRRVLRHLTDVRGRLAGLVLETRSALRRGWRQICFGMAGYLLLQAALLWAILHILHSSLPVAAVFVGFALERALTLAVATPGGVGTAQTGAAAAMIALGGAPETVAAGVLLYSLFTFFLEIPVGAAATLGWWLLGGSSRRVALADAAGGGVPARAPASETVPAPGRRR